MARAAAAHVDVVSTNLNAPRNDGTFPRFYPGTLHRLTGKPLLVSEVYVASMENTTGNRNNHGAYPVAATQAGRAASPRTTLDQLPRLPYVVGVEWFQYHDDPRHGRADGENFRFGLVDVDDRPYDAVTTATAGPARVRAGPAARPDATAGGVPPAPPGPTDDLTTNRALIAWDRERGFVPPASDLPMADLYACWNETSVFLAVFRLDMVEDAYYRDRWVPKEDRMERVVTLGPAGRAAPPPVRLRARLGAGHEPVPSDPTRAARVWDVSGVDPRTRNIAVLELPAALFGRERMRADDALDFAATLRSHCGAFRVEWRGKYLLAR